MKRAKPTDAELEILAVLWELGPATVRQVHERLQPRQRTGYTTTLKTMQVMALKGLLARDESERSHVYRPVASREETQSRLVRDLLDRAFAGSAAQLAVRALSLDRPSESELDRVRELLARFERRERS